MIINQIRINRFQITNNVTTILINIIDPKSLLVPRLYKIRAPIRAIAPKENIKYWLIVNIVLPVFISINLSRSSSSSLIALDVPIFLAS